MLKFCMSRINDLLFLHLDILWILVFPTRRRMTISLYNCSSECTSAPYACLINSTSPHELCFILPHLAQVHHSLSMKFPHPPHVHPRGLDATFCCVSALNRDILSYAEERGFRAIGVARLAADEVEADAIVAETESGRSMPQASQVR